VSIRVLIVDDEEWARRRTVALLRPLPDVEVVGECGSGAEAVGAILDLSPNLVILDVQMPDFDGFEVLQSLDPSRVPLIVFATAYDEYAVRAFETHALDYLLKPFDEIRLRQAIARAREELGRSAVDQRLAALIGDLRRDRTYLRRLVVKAGARILFVRAVEVDWLEAAANYVALHVDGHEYLIRDTIASLERKLDPHQFVRVHRSVIVNLDRIRELSAWVRGEQVLRLTNGASLPVGPSFRSRIQRLLTNAGD
jgi:two-component system, LytTR family, response regulator